MKWKLIWLNNTIVWIWTLILHRLGVLATAWNIYIVECTRFAKWSLIRRVSSHFLIFSLASLDYYLFSSDLTTTTLTTNMITFIYLNWRDRKALACPHDPAFWWFIGNSDWFSAVWNFSCSSYSCWPKWTNLVLKSASKLCMKAREKNIKLHS